jgi:hypothetical protein
MTMEKADTTSKTAAAQRKRVRETIAMIRAANPSFPSYMRTPGEDAEIAEVNELGGLLDEMMKLASPARRAEMARQAARSVTAFRQQLETELRAGSKTAGTMLLGLFTDKHGGGH